METNGSKIGRRRLLVGGAALAGAVALVACGADTATPPAAAPARSEAKTGATPAAAGQPAGGKVVGAMVQASWAEAGMRAATAVYNEHIKERGYSVNLEDTANGWEQKVLSMVKDRSLTWSGHGYVPFFNEYAYIKAGLAAPIDEYVKGSSVPWAKDFKTAFVTPGTYEGTFFEGKQYFVPMKQEIHLLGYRSDYAKELGVEKMPETWEDLEKLLTEAKKALAPKGVTPFFMRTEFYRTLATTFATWRHDFFDEKGLFRLDSPEFFEVINMYKRWFKNELFTKDTFTGDTTLWEKGKVFAAVDSHSWIRNAKKIWGPDKVAGAIPPQPKKSDKPRTFVGKCNGFVFPGAPHPQEATDWLLTIFGPEGKPAETWYAGVTNNSGGPVHKSMLDKVVIGNKDYPELAEWATRLLPNSNLLPSNIGYGYNATQAKVWPWMEKFWGGQLSDKEAVDGLNKEIQAELDKSILRPQ
ncbi:MAG TPA: hypothetical protein VGL23_13000 [Chloroflexota bacterium]